MKNEIVELKKTIQEIGSAVMSLQGTDKIIVKSLELLTEKINTEFSQTATAFDEARGVIQMQQNIFKQMLDTITGIQRNLENLNVRVINLENK
ncbi:hypothetical protein [Flavobacterium sp.]|uniref:hypothetical protein n=1 Tax=Flavobacterium sp. TaxID=239 RepID=UPI00374CE89B